MFNDIINTELRFWSVNTHTHVYVCVCVCVPITASQHTSGKSVRRNVPTSRLSVYNDTVLSTLMCVDNTVPLYTMTVLSTLMCVDNTVPLYTMTVLSTHVCG